MNNQKYKKERILDFLINPKFIAAVWVLVPIIAFLLKVRKSDCNNFKIFVSSFWHAIDQLPLYIPYPDQYNDIFLYGISFTAIIAPFAILPQLLGVALWNITGAVILYFALRLLRLKNWQIAVITLVSLNEIYITALGQQFNTAVTGMIVLSFALIENKKNFWSSFTLVAGTMTKLYGIVGLAFLPFSKRRFTFIGGLLISAAIFFILPMLYSSPSYVISQYGDWIDTLVAKNAKNTYTLYTNISLIGMCHRVTGWMHFSNLWILIPGILLFVSPYFRVGQYQNKGFRLLFLSSTLLFMILFSTGTEESGYISALVAVGLWFVTTPTRHKHRWLNLGLLIYCIIFCSMTPSDAFPQSINQKYIMPYALKALPCTIIWLKIMWELLTCDFSVKPIVEESIGQERKIDLILPCYNPNKGWEDMLIKRNQDFKQQMPEYEFHFILVNDGSKKGITPEIIEKLRTAIPNMTFIDNKENKGKGAAVRDGLKVSTSNKILYTDYDFPYQTHSMGKIVKHLEQGYDIVIATRNDSYYNKLSTRRRFISYSTRILNFVILGMPHTDTQGGLKGFNKNGKKYLETTTIDKFLFDTEFIYRASQDNKLNIEDVSADLREDVHFSDINNNTIMGELGNLLKIAIKG